MICDQCETVAHCLKNGCVPKQQALDRMAENARELRLDYEPAPESGSWYAASDIDKMVRDLDVAMNGDGAAPQAKLCDLMPQLIQRLTSPVQQSRSDVEPVAWYESMAELAAVYGEMCAINETKRDDQTPEQTARLSHLRAECVAIHKKRITLNTTPPNVATPLDETASLAAPAPEERKRQSTRSAWVGLTDAEFYDCDEANACRSAFAYAIEAKLKEKNSD